jgi:hypothetical protein
MAFGQQFLESGRFGKKGLNKIRGAGFADQKDFLTTAGLASGSSIGSLSDALAKGKSGFAKQTLTPNEPVPVPQEQGMPSIEQGLVSQGAATSNFGNSFMNQGQGLANTANEAGSNFLNSSQGDFTNMLRQSQMAEDPRLSGNIQGILDQQRGQMKSNVENYFNTGDPAQIAASKQAQNNVDAQATGMTGSNSANQTNAAVQRGLIRDKASALLGVDQAANQNVIGQLDQTRAGSQSLAALFGNQGTTRGGLGLSALNSGSNINNQYANTGANIANQGFQNQLAGINAGAGLRQQDYNNNMNSFMTQNQIMQQILQNIQGNKANQYSKAQAEKLFNLMQGGSGLGQGLGSLIGGGLGFAIGGPAGATLGAGAGGAIGGSF